MKAYSILTAFLLGAPLVAGAGVITTAVDPDCAGMGTVTAVGKNVAAGKTQALKATAAKGCYFAGWYTADADYPEELVPAELATDYRNPSATCTATEADVTYTARFTTAAEDGLTFDFTGYLEDLEPNEQIEPLECAYIVESVTLPTLTISGLPTGLKYDAKTLTITGKPTAPGVYTVTITGKNASGYQYSQIVRASVANIEGDRIFGADGETWVGDDSLAGMTIDDFFAYETDNLTSITVKGWPTGLSLNTKTGELTGAPTKAGVSVLTATAVYSTTADGATKKTTETATALITVAAVEPDEYDVYLDELENLAVGVPLTDEGLWIGSYVSTNKTGITAVSGLPTGLTAVKVAAEDGVTTDYYVKGTPTKAGAFTITVKVGVLNEDTGKVVAVTTTKAVTVQASESFYIAAAPIEEGTGTVTGSAVVQPNAKVTLKATAAKGYVFAGWYANWDAEADEGETLAAAGLDYRSATQTFTTLTAEDTETRWYARFVTTAEDAEIETDLDGQTYDAASDEDFSETFYVDSLSLPTVTMKGLPTGFAFTPNGDGSYTIAYSAASTKRPTPGLYTVTATITNVSKAKATATFTITVANWTSDYITVDDDLGNYTPGEAIDPISLTNAVNFAAGETLAVSGLPKGLTYNTKANAKTGVEAYTITGTPTVPGVYTLTLTAKVITGATTNASGKVTYTMASATATTTLTVDPFPALTVAMDDEAAAAGCKVTGVGNYIQGSKVTLKAVAAKGWVFAGWDDDGMSLLNRLNPSLSLVTTADDTEIAASFIQIRDDSLYVDDPGDLVFAFKAATNTTVIVDAVETGSYPTLTVSGLPTGLKFDAKTGLLSGTPTKSGIFYVTVNAKNAGGYTYVRIMKMIVLNADGSEPEEAEEVNTANIDLSVLDDIVVTGCRYTQDDMDLVFDVPASEDDSAVTKVTVSGQPTGLSAAITVTTDEAYFVLYGVPTKPGRFTLTVTVTYANKKTAKAVHSFIVYDGGSRYLAVESAGDTLGTVTGSGVYAAGATVKLTAKANKGYAFAGWYDGDSGVETEDSVSYDPFDAATVAGVDYRTATLSMPMLVEELPETLIGAFVTSAEDATVTITFDADYEDETPVFELYDLNDDAEFGFQVTSWSLPTVTAKTLPAGFTLDAANGVIRYSSSLSAKVTPGVYTVTLSAVNVSKATATRVFEIIVPNKTSDVIDCDPDTNAYPITVGTAIGEIFDGIEAAEGYTLTVSGLPTGLSYKNGVFSGVATKSGTYTVTLTAKMTGAATETATITVTVAALPAQLVGTFNGEVDVEVYDVETDKVVYQPAGSLAVTVTAAGKITAKIVRPTGSFSFTATSWDAVTADEATVSMSDTKGRQLDLVVDLQAGYYEDQLSGSYIESDDKSFEHLSAQRNSFADTTDTAIKDALKDAARKYLFAAGDVETTDMGYYEVYVYDNKSTALAATVDTKGNVTFAGKLDKITIKGSTVLLVGGDSGAPALKARMVVKQDAESVLIAELDLSGETPLGYAEVYKCDCKDCAR